ncbi:MAG: hypothetical protein MJ078_07595, partial [Clostridia bacterium]|nr:hypothetical protein [Clostridia bacterium]
LKRLSADKLVIVVSHDREYAEEYADRIIELSDGQVVSDCQANCTAEPAENRGLSFDEEGITVPSFYSLTEEDRLAINDYLRNAEKEVRLTVKKARRKEFVPTKEEEDGKTVRPFALIRSKLPLKTAFRIGSHALKVKKFRLFMTVFLSLVAFTLFGLSDTFGSFDRVEVCKRSIRDSGITYSAVVKETKHFYDDGEFAYWDEKNLTDEDIRQINLTHPVYAHGVYTYGVEEKFFGLTQIEYGDYAEEAGLYATYFTGVTELGEDELKPLSFSLLAGEMPKGDRKEMAITAFLARTFMKGGLFEGQYAEDGTPVYTPIATPADMVGKTLPLGEYGEYRVSGILDTGRYEEAFARLNRTDTSDLLMEFFLQSELEDCNRHGFNCLAILGKGGLDVLTENQKDVLHLSFEAHTDYENREWVGCYS